MIKIVKDITPYLCKREECIELIKDSINQYSRQELVDILPHAEILKIIKCIDNIFCNVNYDEKGTIYLFDELNPIEITDCLWNSKEFTTNKGIVHAFVCRTLMKRINSLYAEVKNLDKELIVKHDFTSKQYKKRKDAEILEKEYLKRLIQLSNSEPKRLRGK